ncbi:MAG: TRAP transporter small permease subunit [Hyphomicrobiales bacterium]|jgi:TRAP-type mannitol/chloroaromatic compound transport system permease small subunit|nr:TRAP transporter small permease subunit [Hyphomicrobiales bacterium]
MDGLLSFSRIVDTINERLGKATAWLVLAAVVVSAGNATVRKAFNWSSNGLLEAQWYLFGVVFMIGAAWTMKANEHVRVDVVSSRLSKVVRDRIELFGLIVFFFPFALVHLYYSYPFFMTSFRTQEWSTNAGGLIIWPAKFMVLFGFFLLTLQGVSELIKRVAVMRGIIREKDEMKAHVADNPELARIVDPAGVQAPGTKH